MLDMLDDLSPLSCALIAITWVSVWFYTSQNLLCAFWRWLKIPDRYLLALSLFSIIPFYGTLTLVCLLLGLMDRYFLVTLFLSLTVWGAWLSVRFSYLKSTCWNNLKAQSYSWWIWVLIGVCKGIELLFTAHPQRLYDQLSYHLVIPKRLLLGSIGDFDPHLYMGSVFEYALLWPRLFFDHDILQISIGQCAVYVSVLGTVFLAGISLFHRYSWAILLMFLIYPAFVANPEMFSIAKSDAFLFAGTSLLLCAYHDEEKDFLSLFAVLAAMLCAFKFTAIHLLLAFLPLGLLSGLHKQHKLWTRYLLLTLPGGFALLLVLIKNLSFDLSPLYPVDTKFLSDFAMSGPSFHSHWKHVAFPVSSSYLDNLPAGLKFILRNPYLLFWLLALLLNIPKRASNTVVDSKTKNSKAIGICSFILSFSLLWPLFYDRNIYTRFISPMPAAWLFLGMWGYAHLPRPRQKGLAILGVLLALSGSQIDSMLIKMWRWNQVSAVDSLNLQNTRIIVTQKVNTLTTKDDLILVDDIEKYFFKAKVLFGTLTLREQGVWQQLLNDPQQTVKQYSIKVLVRSVQKRGYGPYHFAGPLDEVWELLQSRGRVERIGNDEVLWL